MNDGKTIMNDGKTIVNGGLENIGLTCGINALVQCIAHCRGLVDVLNKKHGNPESLSSELNEVVQLLTNGKSVRPNGLVHKLYSTFKDHLHPCEQHDISELWMLIADKVSDELGTKCSSMNRNTDIHKQNNGKTSKWQEAVQGLTMNVIVCRRCNHEHVNPETFIALSLDIPSNNAKMTDMLVRYISIERLSDYTCDNCKSHDCQKQLYIRVLPRILVVSLKRFKVVSQDNNIHFEKIKTPVGIIDKLSIDNHIYRLCATGNHHGSYHGGHYTASCRLRNGEWVEYDDADRRQIHFPFSSNTSAYILFYEEVTST